MSTEDPTERELDRLLAAINQDDPDVQAIMQDGHVALLLKLLRTSPAYRVNEDALDLELDALMAQSELAAFDIDKGSEGLKESVESRYRLLGVRHRLVALFKSLRKVEERYAKVYRRASARLRGLEAAGRMTVKAHEAAVAIALGDIIDTQAALKRLLECITKALTHLDQSSKAIDAWYVTYQQYRYETSKARPHGSSRSDDEDEDAPPTRRNLARGR